MIRLRVISILLLVLAVSPLTLEGLSIDSADRNVNLNSIYPTETVKIAFTAKQDDISQFYHVLPAEWDDNIARISFRKGKDQRGALLKYTKSPYIYVSMHIKQNGVSYALYRVQFTSNYHIGDKDSLFIHAVYLNRYVNLPASITLTEDQKLQYQDAKYFVSPYTVQQQQNTYKFLKVIEFEEGGEKKGVGAVAFKATNRQPYQNQRHTIFGVNNQPQVQFTSVQKSIQISHWGNIAIEQKYQLRNTGPSLKGQFSRVTYNSRSQTDARAAYKGLQFDLPLSIHGLYYFDEVGNISTSKAYKDHSNGVVRVGLTPRFAIFGGWKSNWVLGYNFRTEGMMWRDGQIYQVRNVKVEYAMEKILSEDYTVKIILPQGAEDVQIKISNQDAIALPKPTLSEGYLDFIGKPTYSLHGLQHLPKDHTFTITYRLSQWHSYKKPIMIFLAIFAVLLLSILSHRVKLSAFELHHHHHHHHKSEKHHEKDQ